MQRLLPLLPAAVALWFRAVAPNVLVDGVGGAVFSVAALLLVALAVAMVLLRALQSRIAYPAPSASATAILVVGAVVLAGAVLSAGAARVDWVLIGAVGPALGVLLVAMGWWTRRAAS